MGLLNQRVQPIVFDDSQFNQLLGLGGSAVNMPLLNKRAQPVLLEATQFAQLLAAMGGGLLSVETGIVASPTQTQVGATQLNDYSTVHEISVCATVNDAVRLPPAVAGKMVIICNKGVEQAQVWPAIGDQLDPNSPNVTSNFVQFIAVDDTQWYSSK